MIKIWGQPRYVSQFFAMKRPAHWYYYRAMLRRLIIAIMLGIMSAVIVWLFHQAMLGLEWVLFARTDGSLVAAASSINY